MCRKTVFTLQARITDQQLQKLQRAQNEMGMTTSEITRLMIDCLDLLPITGTLPAASRLDMQKNAERISALS